MQTLLGKLAGRQTGRQTDSLEFKQVHTTPREQVNRQASGLTSNRKQVNGSANRQCSRRPIKISFPNKKKSNKRKGTHAGRALYKMLNYYYSKHGASADFGRSVASYLAIIISYSHTKTG